jgi:8-oxo-dGTP pyrophosphatase MutT (NUDIX family)
MAPRPRLGWDPRRVPAGLRQAAALVLLYPHAESAHLPLTVRGDALRHHTGQVSLPGGAVDEGESIEVAALREAAEEVGIAPAAVEIVGRLTPLPIPVSGFLLHPVVGVAFERPVFEPAVDEVARLLEVPVARLRDPATIDWESRTFVRGGEPVAVDVPFFALDGEKVWGATAMVLAELIAALEEPSDARSGGPASSPADVGP